MMYTIKGIIDDREIKITWKDGELIGGRLSVLYAEGAIAEREGETTGAEPNVTYHAYEHLMSELSSYIILKEMFDSVISESGKTPEAFDPKRTY